MPSKRHCPQQGGIWMGQLPALKPFMTWKYFNIIWVTLYERDSPGLSYSLERNKVPLRQPRVKIACHGLWAGSKCQWLPAFLTWLALFFCRSSQKLAPTLLILAERARAMEMPGMVSDPMGGLRRRRGSAGWGEEQGRLPNTQPVQHIASLLPSFHLTRYLKLVYIVYDFETKKHNFTFVKVT